MDIGQTWRSAWAALRVLLLTLLLSPVATAVETESTLATNGQAAAQTGDVKPGGGILDMDIEQLSKTPVVVPQMDIPVTSVEKHESTVGKSPAAIYVMTSEMIRRSAANNVPDLLRLVPGVEVCRSNADSWAISIRGANDRFTNKLLVLIDGRTVYSPIFAGVYWDVQDLFLEDIERIEVIRGPGGTLWGDNAVNGVINIITKRAKDTQGSVVTYGGGTEDLALGGGARYGGTLGEDWTYRVYGKHREEAPGYYPEGDAFDGYRQARTGFRADWQPKKADCNLMTIQGDCYKGTSNSFGLFPYPNDEEPYSMPFALGERVVGGNILGRFTHTIDDESDWSLQTYYDRSDRNSPIWYQKVNILDVDFQNRFPLGDRHDVTWGAEFQQTHDNEICEGFVVGFDPATRTTSLYNMFLQDQITLVEDRLFFTIGTKVEWNDYTDFEYQPSARVLLTPSNKQSFWAAISRAVVLPSRFDFNGYFTSYAEDWPYPVPPVDKIYPRQYGNPAMSSETLWAYELGYRAQPTKKFSYDIALFYYDYTELRGSTSGTPFMDPDFDVLIYPVTLDDDSKGSARGGEFGVTYAMTEAWKLSSWYSYMFQTCSPDRNPHNQARLMSSWNLGPQWQFDMILRYVDSIERLDVPQYTEMDLRLSWQLRKHLEASVIGRNLLQSHHWEFAQGRYPYYVTEVERSVYGSLTWRY